ncbi:MAG: DUF423 domain-containing protein [Rhodospirillales bacterium]|nr:DUF423 domain-containing protein [Rhodospirillales bacterium]
MLNISPRIWATIGALNCFFAVALAALASHYLGEMEKVGTFLKGTHYEMSHGLALFAVAWVSSKSSSPFAAIAGWAFTLGIIFFCGALYLLPLTGIKLIGLAAPVGGILLLSGWLSLALASWKME